MGKSPRDRRDIFYRRAKIEIDDKFTLFEGVRHAVDLCAAPGSWSQVLSRKLGTGSKIVAVDLQEMAPLEGVIQLQGDITRHETAESIISHFEGEKADLVVCDGAPDVTGMHDMDEYIQAQLVLAALSITTHVLREGGTFVTKIFRGKDVTLLFSKFGMFFKTLFVTKPKASRSSSIEAFLVARDFALPEGYELTMLKSLMDERYDEFRDSLTGENRNIVPFLACGDLSQFDADMNYELDEESIDPVTSPLAPPYRKQLEMKRSNDPNLERS